VLYSGTVAGAIEGAFFGVTSVAVSHSMDTPPDYRRTARMAVDLIEQLMATRPRTGSLWNINFPASTPGGPRGVQTVPMGVRRHTDVMERRLDPRGRPYYWSGLNPIENHHMEPGTDVKELTDGYVTITPLRFDLTDAGELKRVGSTPWTLSSRDGDSA
jgi:5'-nucleotidase